MDMEMILIPICVILLVLALLISIYGWWGVLIGAVTVAALALAAHAARVLYDNWMDLQDESNVGPDEDDEDAPPNYRSH